MELHFSQLCHDEQLRTALKQYVDTCGSKGQSYEFPQCIMPEGCIPSRVCLGFFRRGNGSFVLYWRPLVAYRGKNRVLELWFRQCIWTFDSYELLSSRLHSLRTEFPVSVPARKAQVEPVFSTGKTPILRNSVPPLLSQIPAIKILTSPWPASYAEIYQSLSARIFGQETAVEAAAYYLYSFTGKVAPARPLSLILHGPTGVGKSALGKAVKPILEGCGNDAWQFVWTDLNTFTQPHSVHRLTGAPPGYVGYEDAPVLAAVRKNPRTVFMFEKKEKAHPDVLKVLMSILDEGRCTVSHADTEAQRDLDFRKCIFIFTTNLDLFAATGRVPGFTAPSSPEPLICNTKAASPEELAERLFVQNEIGRKALVRHGVLREIAGRFTGFIGFCDLSRDAQLQILAQQAISLGSEYGLLITKVTPEAVKMLFPAAESFSIRSAIYVLEAKLAPLYQKAAADNTHAVGYHLTTASGILTLLPDEAEAVG